MTRTQLQFAWSPALALLITLFVGSGDTETELIDTAVTHHGRRISLVLDDEAMNIIAETADSESRYGLPLNELLPGEALVQAVLAPWTTTRPDGVAIAVATEMDGLTSYRFLFTTAIETADATWFVSPVIFASTGRPFDILNLTTFPRGDSLSLTFRRGFYRTHGENEDVRWIEFNECCPMGRFTAGRNVLMDARTGKKLEFGVVL